MSESASRRRVLGSQNVSRMCMVCGRENPFGLQGRFYELEGGELLGVFDLREEHQGYPGRLHGGIASAVLDETMGRAVNLGAPDPGVSPAQKEGETASGGAEGEAGSWGVTVELNVRYRQPVPLDKKLHVVGRITKDSRRLFEGTGEIVLEDGTVAVEAHGKYLRMPIERIAEELVVEEQWFPDDRETPGEVELREGGSG